jgi:ABC-type Mn2+/Zn2+ transport system ATPase subunit
MIQLTGLTKSFGERILLDDVTWTVGDGDRVGLCGPNGAGKTTLLRMLAGIDEPDRGGVVKPANLTVGYLPQDGLEHTGRTLFAEASLAFQPLLEAKAEIERIEHALADPALPDGEHEALLVRYHDLTELFRREEGHSIDLRVTQVLEGLGFAKPDFEKPAGTFSGGWQMRIALAKLLLGRPTLLLLDEPTNHLDLEARNWLESYLVGYPHAVILVEGGAGAEPDQDVGQGRADRSAAGTQARPLHVSGVSEERPHGARDPQRDEVVRRSRCARRNQSARRARRPHRPGRAERRRQIDPDAHAVGRAPANRP